MPVAWPYGFFLVLLACTVFCAIEGVREFQRSSYLLAGFAALCVIGTVVVLLWPVRTHAVKIDLIDPSQRQ